MALAAVLRRHSPSVADTDYDRPVVVDREHDRIAARPRDQRRSRRICTTTRDRSRTERKRPMPPMTVMTLSLSPACGCTVRRIAEATARADAQVILPGKEADARSQLTPEQGARDIVHVAWKAGKDLSLGDRLLFQQLPEAAGEKCGSDHFRTEAAAALDQVVARGDDLQRPYQRDERPEKRCRRARQDTRSASGGAARTGGGTRSRAAPERRRARGRPDGRGSRARRSRPAGVPG